MRRSARETVGVQVEKRDESALVRTALYPGPQTTQNQQAVERQTSENWTRRQPLLLQDL